MEGQVCGRGLYLIGRKLDVGVSDVGSLVDIETNEAQADFLGDANILDQLQVSSSLTKCPGQVSARFTTPTEAPIARAVSAARRRSLAWRASKATPSDRMRSATARA